MQYRQLGRTPFKISEVSFGTWAMGGWWGPLDDKSALEALHRAIELGVNFFDTAFVYGDGHSEQLIAKAFSEKKKRQIVATKIPPKNFKWPAEPNTPLKEAFPRDWIRECTERSLKNLNTDCVEIQQLHVWTECWLNETEWVDELQKLKKEGKIRAFGVSINDHQPDSALALVKSGLIDTVQVIHNIFDQTPEQQLLPLCREFNVGVIVRVPFDEGGLTGTLTPSTIFPEGDWRSNYFTPERLKETCARVDRLKKFLTPEVDSIPKLALKYCLAHPAVSSVIPGMRRPAHVEENAKASDGKSLPQTTVDKLHQEAWPRNFYPVW
ncbi:MAG: aldo/keto reductase [Deltaproteobacteria bacterium]|nr:aldo/keto reductase [Deltaproteobacteria bacterium]